MTKRGPYEKTGKSELPAWRINRIAAWRKFRGMTQEALAEAAGIESAGTVSDLENGKVGYSDESLHNMAKALRVTPGKLLDVDPPVAETKAAPRAKATRRA